MSSVKGAKERRWKIPKENAPAINNNSGNAESTIGCPSVLDRFVTHRFPARNKTLRRARCQFACDWDLLHSCCYRYLRFRQVEGQVGL